MSLVEINAMTDEATCETGASAECGFDVINPADTRQGVGAEVIGELESKGWAKVVEPLEVNLPPRGQEKFKVRIDIPANAPPKAYSLKLRIYDLGDPENAVESGAVAVTVPAGTAEPAASPDPSADPGGKNWGLIIGAIAGGLALLGGIGVLVVMLLPSGIAVPDVVGLLESDAAIALEQAGLVAGSVTSEPSEAAEGTVIEQIPGANERVEETTEVRLVLAAAVQRGTVPELSGKSLIEAINSIKAAGLTGGTVTEELSPEPSGTVISQTPAAGEPAAPGTAVDLVVSLVSVQVPQVFGFKVNAARAALLEAGLASGAIDSKVTGNAQGGSVLDQDPKPGVFALPGTPVRLVVEKVVVHVPLVTKKTYSEAEKLIVAAGLLVGKVDHKQTGQPALTVLSQNPAADAQVDPGIPVSLVVEGKKTVVPSVEGKTLDQAVTLLSQQGLKVSVTNQTGAGPVGVIVSQSPKAKAQVAPGSDVSLVKRVARPQLTFQQKLILQSKTPFSKQLKFLRRDGEILRYVAPAEAESENED